MAYLVVAGALCDITKAAIPTTMRTTWTPSRITKAASPRRYLEKAAVVVKFEGSVDAPKSTSPLISPNCTRPSRTVMMIAVLGFLHWPIIRARSITVNPTSPYACVGATDQRAEPVART